MQVILNFTFDKLNLPIAYNVMIQGLIYNALGKGNSEYSDFLHNKTSNSNADSEKLFTFGRLNGLYKIVRNNIIFQNTVSLQIRSPEENFIKFLIRGLTSGRSVRIGKNEIMLENIICKNDTITENNIHCITETPVTFKKQYPQDAVFDCEFAKEKLIKNAKEKWLSAGYSEEDFVFDIDFNNVVPVKKQCIFKGTYITAWETEFYLNGNLPVLNFIYNTGIGARNSQGFGMFNILD